MNRKVKQEKGITLVALIITIIVLLILAVVTIAAVSGNGIINHAENARDSYKTAQNNEASMLSTYETYLNTQTSKSASNTNNGPITFTLEGTQYQVTSGTTFGQFVSDHPELNYSKDNLIRNNDGGILINIEENAYVFSNTVISANYTYEFEEPH